MNRNQLPPTKQRPCCRAETKFRPASEPVLIDRLTDLLNRGPNKPGEYLDYDDGLRLLVTFRASLRNGAVICISAMTEHESPAWTFLPGAWDVAREGGKRIGRLFKTGLVPRPYCIDNGVPCWFFPFELEDVR